MYNEQRLHLFFFFQTTFCICAWRLLSLVLLFWQYFRFHRFLFGRFIYSNRFLLLQWFCLFGFALFLFENSVYWLGHPWQTKHTNNHSKSQKSLDLDIYISKIISIQNYRLSILNVYFSFPRIPRDTTQITHPQGDSIFAA